MRLLAFIFLFLSPVVCGAQDTDDWVWPRSMEEIDALPDDTETLGVIRFEKDYWDGRNLSRFTKLRKLKIPADDLHRAAKCETVEELYISDNFSDDLFILLRKWSSLRVINTGGVAGWASFSGSGLMHLPNPERVESLGIWGCNDAGAKQIARCSGLVSLSVGAQYITDVGVREFSGLSKLKSFEIGGCSSLTDDSLKSLAKIEGLEVVRISNAKDINDAGLEAIAALKLLRVLDLSCNSIDGSGLSALKEHPSIEELHLRGTGVKERGLDALASCPNLRVLSLELCGALKAAGLARIVGAKLRYLNLRGNGLAGTTALEALNGFPTLEELNLEMCAWVTDQIVSGLVLPNLRVLNCYGTGCKGGGNPEGLPAIEDVTLGLDNFEGLTLDRWKAAELKTLRLRAVKNLKPAALEAIGRMPTLQVLEIDRAPALTLEAWQAITGLSALRLLDLSGSAVPSGVLPSLTCLDVIEEFDLGWIDQPGENELEVLMKCPRLVKVVTWGTNLTDDQLRRLVKLRPAITARVDRSHGWELLYELGDAYPQAHFGTLD